MNARAFGMKQPEDGHALRFACPRGVCLRRTSAISLAIPWRAIGRALRDIPDWSLRLIAGGGGGAAGGISLFQASSGGGGGAGISLFQGACSNPSGGGVGSHGCKSARVLAREAKGHAVDVVRSRSATAQHSLNK
eukprot:1188549-Prorocentrum_minimum.AAC.2